MALLLLVAQAEGSTEVDAIGDDASDANPSFKRREFVNSNIICPTSKFQPINKKIFLYTYYEIIRTVSLHNVYVA
jgi:hypothetical protein